MAYPTVTFNKVHEYALFRTGRDTQDPASNLAKYPDIAALLNMRLRECWEYAHWDFLKATATSTLPAGIRIKGFGLAEVNDYYSTDAAQVNSKDAYTLSGDQTVEWSGTAWEVFDSGNAVAYTSSEDVATPDLVVTWAATGNGVAPLGEVSVRSYHSIDISDDKTVLGVFNDDPRDVENVGALRTESLVAGELRVQAGAPDTVYYQYIPPAPDWIADSPVPTVYELFRLPATELVAADVLGQDGNNDDTKVSRAEARGYKMLDRLALRFAVMDTQPRVQVRTRKRMHSSYRY